MSWKADILDPTLQLREGRKNRVYPKSHKMCNFEAKNGYKLRSWKADVLDPTLPWLFREPQKIQALRVPSGRAGITASSLNCERNNFFVCYAATPAAIPICHPPTSASYFTVLLRGFRARNPNRVQNSCWIGVLALLYQNFGTSQKVQFRFFAISRYPEPKSSAKQLLYWCRCRSLPAVWDFTKSSISLYGKGENKYFLKID